MKNTRNVKIFILMALIIFAVGISAYYVGLKSSTEIKYTNSTPTNMTSPDAKQRATTNTSYSVASTSDSSVLSAINNQQAGFSANSNNEYWIKVLSPKGGEYYCMGKDVPIDWQTSSNIESVNMYLIARESSWLIGTYPSSYNESGLKDYTGEIIWKAGDVSTPHAPWGSGQGYFILVQGWGASGSFTGRINGINSAPFVMNDCSSG